ncbi:MAG TPA: hypothetical protein VNO81_14185, partial [Candidatus Nitrosotenuis sp.]|nr:hypothetical protein [Candidatus Nitrosotenuis sp.]
MSLLLALVCLLCPLSARAQSDRQAVEIIERLKSRANQVRSFQGLVQLQRLDPDFLGQFYPPNPMYLNTNVRGILNYKAVDSFNLYLTQQAERYYQFQARGGRSLSYLTEVTIPGNINEGIARPTAAPKVDPFGQPVFPTPVASPEASPSPQASATPLPDFMQLGFRRKGPFFDHPLSFLWPYELRPFGAAQFRLLSAEAPVYNRNAVQLQITSQDTNHTVWIDKANDQVLQVQVDYPDGGRLEVRYTGNYPPDRETGFIFYGQVQCFYYPPSSPIPRDVYLAQLIDPVANVKIATANEPFNPRPIPEKVRPPLFNFKVPPVLSTGLKVVIGLLLAALLVLGYR